MLASLTRALRRLSLRRPETYPAGRSAIEMLPNEVLRIIMSFICDFTANQRFLLDNPRLYSRHLSSLSKLCTASRRLHEAVIPVLYFYICPPPTMHPHGLDRLLWEGQVRRSAGLPTAEDRFQHTRLATIVLPWTARYQGPMRKNTSAASPVVEARQN